MEEYRFHLTENPLPLAVIKDSFKIYFQEMEKLLPVEDIFEILEQNGFHQPENPFPLARMKDRFKTAFILDERKTGINVCYLHKSLAERSEKQIKTVYPLARKSLSTNRNAFKNTFPLYGKIKLAVAAGESQNGRKKKGLPQPENQFPLAEIRLFFKNWISRFPETEQKSLNKIILFQLDRKLVSASKNGEFD